MTAERRQVIRHADEVAWVASPDRVVVLRLADLASEPVMLTGTAAVIWELLAEPTAVESLLDSLGDGYDVEVGEIEASVTRFVSSCLETGLLEEADEAEPPPS